MNQGVKQRIDVKNFIDQTSRAYRTLRAAIKTNPWRSLLCGNGWQEWCVLIYPFADKWLHRFLRSGVPPIGRMADAPP